VANRPLIDGYQEHGMNLSKEGKGRRIAHERIRKKTP
jgi:hypothetical protein